MKHLMYFLITTIHLTLILHASSFLPDKAPQTLYDIKPIADMIAQMKITGDSTGWQNFLPFYTLAREYGGQEECAKDAARQMNLYKSLYEARTIESMRKDLEKLNTMNQEAIRNLSTTPTETNNPILEIGSFKLVCDAAFMHQRVALTFLLKEAERADKK